MRVAVVDDSKEDAQQLTEYLEKYEMEHDLLIRIIILRSASRKKTDIPEHAEIIFWK